MKRIAWVMAVVLAVGLATQVNSASKSGGIIKVKTLGMVIDVKTPDGKVVSIPANKDTPAPAGDYPTAGITLYGKENNTVIWSIESRGPFGDLKTVSVQDGQTTTIEGGAPLAIKTSVAQSKGPTGAPMVSVGLAILGKAKESYATSSIKRSKILVPAPKLQIVGEDGKVLASGNFEYG